MPPCRPRFPIQPASRLGLAVFAAVVLFASRSARADEVAPRAAEPSPIEVAPRATPGSIHTPGEQGLLLRLLAGGVVATGEGEAAGAAAVAAVEWWYPSAAGLRAFADVGAHGGGAGFGFLLGLPRGAAWPYLLAEGGFTISGGAGFRGMAGVGAGLAAELGGLDLSLEAHVRWASLDFAGERFNEGKQYLILGGVTFGD